MLFLCAESGSRVEAVEDARACLGRSCRCCSAATDTEHQQQTERYDTLVELAAAQVLRQAAGWTLVVARVQDDHIVAVFQRDWP